MSLVLRRLKELAIVNEQLAIDAKRFNCLLLMYYRGAVQKRYLKYRENAD